MMKRINPVIRNLAIGAGTAAIAAFYVLSGHAARDYPDIENIKVQIAMIEAEIDVVETTEDLPRLPNTWHSLSIIASTFGVEALPLNAAKDAGINDSDIPGGTPWFGVLQGNTKDVAMAAIEIQKVVPIIFGAAALDNSVIGLSFAALGSEQEN